jgi:hypothetical protein
MIGHLLVCDVLGFFMGHVAGSAVRVLLVMARCKARMARKAAAPVIADAIVGSHRGVWIMTGGAGEAVAAPALAGTFQQRFPLAGSAASRPGFAAVLKVDRIIEKIVAGLKGAHLATQLNYSYFSLQMAFETNRIAANRFEFVGIEDGSLSFVRQML